MDKSNETADFLGDLMEGLGAGDGADPQSLLETGYAVADTNLARCCANNELALCQPLWVEDVMMFVEDLKKPPHYTQLQRDLLAMQAEQKSCASR